MKRPTSAFLADSTEELDNGSQFSPSPPPTPSPATKKAKKSPVSPTKSAGPSSKGKKVEPQSPKGKLLAYFLKTGLKAVDKAEAERLVRPSSLLPSDLQQRVDGPSGKECG